MYLGNIYPTWQTALWFAAAVRKIKLHAPPVGSVPCGSRSFRFSISACRNIQRCAACVRFVNGASCFHLPFALARAGKFYPSITYYGKNENLGNVFEKNFKKFFSRHKKARLWSVFSRVCIGFFFRWCSACSPAVAVGVLGGKILSVACPFPVKNVTVAISRFYQLSITIALRISAKKDIFRIEEMEKLLSWGSCQTAACSRNRRQPQG